MPVPGFISLGDLANHIKGVLSDAFAGKSYWVVADVTDHKFYPSRRAHYFSLTEKDPKTNTLSAKIAVVSWADGGSVAIDSFQQVTGEKFRSDIHVLVNVSVSFHKQYGLQLVLNDIDTTFTIGQLEQQRQDTVARLLKEYPDFIRLVGNRFVTRNNQLSLPRVIQNVAVLTSSSAAGYADFRNTLETNKYGYKVQLDLYFATVQGEANENDLVQRLIDIHTTGIGYDAVAIIRGGGSQTDFLLFNQFNIARAVAKFPIPIIVGIGHQINETLVDLMAHTSVKTPSIAAEMIITNNRMFEDELLTMQQTIIIQSQRLLNAKQQELTWSNGQLVLNTKSILQERKNDIAAFSQVIINETKTLLFRRRNDLSAVAGTLIAQPRIIIGNRLNDLTNAANNLKSYTTKYLTNAKANLAHSQSLIRILSPASIMKRGFAMIYKDGKIMADADQIQPGNDVKIVFGEHELGATINTKIKTANNESDL